MAYRFDTFAMFFSESLSFFALFYLWSSIYRQGGQIGNYSFPDIVLYYFAANFIALVIKGTDVAWNVGDEIRLGKIVGVMLRPISYSKYKFFQVMGSYFFRGISYFALFALVGAFLFPYLGFVLDPWRAFFSLALMGLGGILYFLIFYIVGLTTFWLGLVRGFNFGFMMLVIFLEGGLVPLDLLPSAITKINDFLPFKHIMFVPISVFTGRMDADIWLFLVPAIWIAVFYFFAKFIFKKGIKAYEGFGI